MTDDNWKQTVEARLRNLEQGDAVELVHRENLASRLTGIEDTLKWLVRLVIGALLLAAVAFVVQGGMAK